jgi:DNA-binding YbaB/EbfC family protein
MLKGLGNIASLMRQAQQMGGQMQEVQEKLKSQRAQGAAGGGMVTVEVNGASEVLGIKIEPELIAGGDREMIEDLVTAAVNQAMAKSKQLHLEAMKSMTGGMNLPGLDEALQQFTGGPSAP